MWSIQWILKMHGATIKMCTVCLCVRACSCVLVLKYLRTGGPRIFKKNLKNNPGSRKVTWNKFRTGDPQFWSDLWTFLLSDAFCLMRVNRLQIFCMRGWRENWNRFALNGRRYASQFSRSGDLSTPVRQRVSRGRITYLLSPTRMMWQVMYFVIRNFYFFPIHIIVCWEHIPYIVV